MRRVIIAGSSGLVGTALVNQLIARGDSVTRLVRGQGSAGWDEGSLKWDPYRRQIEREKIEGHDVVICLSGANLSDSRWTRDRMRTLVDSRVKPTAFLSETISKLKRKPSAFLVASAVGFYGNMPSSESMDEGYPAGTGFLADLCKRWEDAASAARAAGIRTLHLRMGVILTKKGGALAKMLPFFRKGLGGKVGSGRQMLSWITLNDTIRAFLHIIDTPTLNGPVNVVTPNAVSNSRFARSLGAVLGKPAVAFLPATAARIMYGKMADETILSSQNAIPKKLIDSGFTFEHFELEPALKQVLSGLD